MVAAVDWLVTHRSAISGFRQSELSKTRRLSPLCRSGKFQDLSGRALVLGRDNCIDQRIQGSTGLAACLVIAAQIVAGSFKMKVCGGKVAFHSFSLLPAVRQTWSVRLTRKPISTGAFKSNLPVNLIFIVPRRSSPSRPCVEFRLRQQTRSGNRGGFLFGRLARSGRLLSGSPSAALGLRQAWHRALTLITPAVHAGSVHPCRALPERR